MPYTSTVMACTGSFYCETPLDNSNSVANVGAYFMSRSYSAQARHTDLFFHLTRSRISPVLIEGQDTNNSRVHTVKIEQENQRFE